MQTMTAQRQDSGPTRHQQRIPALLGLVALVLLAGAAALPLRSPPASPTSAPTNEFSAERAMPLVAEIASAPRPAGSQSHTRVREYLVEQLQDLGLQPQVSERVVARSGVAGSVANVYATIAGQDPTGQVLLVAHYDSTPTGPGAGDNAAGVAAVLEVVRALQSGPQPRNDIGVLFTDAEENGLLGAAAFVESAAVGDPDRVVALNLEARGVSGPAVMFEMIGTGLTSAVRAADPVTTSLGDEIYQILPNDTDLTVLTNAGMRGLNFAFLGGAAHYHTPHDDLARLDPGSVQDIGDSILAATRHLAAADLTPGGTEATFFSLPGAVVSYPGWLVLPLAGLAGLGYLLLLWWAGRQHMVKVRAVLRAAVGFPLPVLGAVLVGFGVWSALLLSRTEYALTVGHVYRPGWYAWGALALVLVLLAAWYRWARRKASAVEVAVAAIGWFSLLALAAAVLLPGAAYVFTWPALIGMIGVAALLRWTGVDSPWRGLAGVGLAAPAVLLLLPVTALLVPTFGLWLLSAPLLLAVLLAVGMLATIEPLPARRRFTAGMVAVAIVGAGLIGVRAATETYDESGPRPVSLGYVFEADTGDATWVSLDSPAAPVVGELLTGESVELGDRVPSLGGASIPTGPAPVASGLSEPRVADAVVEEQGGVRTVQVRLLAPADAYQLLIYADTSDHEILGATVAGLATPGVDDPPDAGADWGWSLRYVAPPLDGIDLRIRARGEGPVRLRIVSYAAGFPAGSGAPTLPPELSWAPWPSVAGQTFTVRTFTL